MYLSFVATCRAWQGRWIYVFLSHLLVRFIVWGYLIGTFQHTTAGATRTFKVVVFAICT